MTFHCAEATVKNWSGEDWVGGAPTVTMAPGTLAAWPALREPHDRVHFAGTETATQWIGWVVMMMIMIVMIIMMMMTRYMDGAVESGMRAAWEVLNIIKPQSLSPHELKVTRRMASCKVYNEIQDQEVL